jgi:hypothetical protein
VSIPTPHFGNVCQPLVRAWGKGCDESKHTKIPRCKKGKVLTKLVKRGRDLIPGADITSFLFPEKDIHMYKVPFKHIKKYLQLIRCKNLMSSADWFDSPKHHSRMNVPWGEEEEEALIYDCWISICSLSLSFAQATPFLFLSVFWGISPSRRALCRTAPHFHMFPCSHGNISFLQNGKEVRKLKESCLHTGRFPYLCVLLRFGNTLRLTPLGDPPSWERTGARTSPPT